jgi:hypothetical protein
MYVLAQKPNAGTGLPDGTKLVRVEHPQTAGSGFTEAGIELGTSNKYLEQVKTISVQIYKPYTIPPPPPAGDCENIAAQYGGYGPIYGPLTTGPWQGWCWRQGTDTTRQSGSAKGYSTHDLLCRPIAETDSAGLTADVMMAEHWWRDGGYCAGQGFHLCKFGRCVGNEVYPDCIRADIVPRNPRRGWSIAVVNKKNNVAWNGYDWDWLNLEAAQDVFFVGEFTTVTLQVHYDRANGRFSASAEYRPARGGVYQIPLQTTSEIYAGINYFIGNHFCWGDMPINPDCPGIGEVTWIKNDTYYEINPITGQPATQRSDAQKTKMLT